MAKRRRSNSGQFTRTTRAISVYRPPAPIIRVSAPRAAKAKKHHRRRSGHAVGLDQKTMLGLALGGAALGFIEKTFPNLPTVPLIGRKGTIAIGAYILHRRGTGGGILRDVALAAAVMAGYELGKDGKISGDDVDGDIARQVSGHIAQQV
jgi:hypothetical protein